MVLAAMRNGVFVGGGGVLSDCCCAVPCTDVAANRAPFGCTSCLCSGANNFQLCVSGETAGLAVLNTSTMAVRLAKVSAGVYEYVQVGVRKFVLTLAGNAGHYEVATIQAYTWSGSAWTLQRSGSPAAQMTGSECVGVRMFGSATYWFKAGSDWTQATQIAVTFSGVNYRTGSGCAPFDFIPQRRYHLSGDLNGTTYSAMLPAYPGSGSGVAPPCNPASVIVDNDVKSFDDFNFGHLNIFLGWSSNSTLTSGRRNLTVLAYTRPVPGLESTVNYFAGAVQLGTGPCKGTHVISNRYTSECHAPFSGGLAGIGWGGIGTMVLS